MNLLDLIEQRESIVSLGKVPFWDERNISAKQMNNKALGVDGISANILKFGGDRKIGLLEQVINDMLESEAPQEWRDTIILSLHK